MRNLIIAYSPIEWPASKPRTLSNKRVEGLFHKGSKSYHKRDVTLHEARIRITEAIHGFTRTGRPWVIDPEECEIRSMWPHRQDGGFMARSRPDDPGAVLYFPWKGKDMTIAIDRYTMLEQNMCAIAACLDSLRTLERHDGSVLDQAMSGFAALPPPIVVANWRSILAFGQGETPSLDEVKARYRKMIRDAHPDRGGQPGVAADLNRAWKDAQEELGHG